MNGNIRRECADPVFEQHRRPLPGVDGWAVPIVRVDVMPHEVQAHIVSEGETLVLMDSGGAGLDCRLGLRHVSCELQAGAIGYFPPGTELRQSRWRWNRARRIELDLKTIGSEHQELGELLPSLGSACRLEFRDDGVANLLRGLAAEAANGHPHGRLFADSLLMGLVLRMARQADAPAVRERGGLSPAQKRALDEYLDAHLAEPVKMADLARAVGFSPVHFVRLLKKTVGLTPHDYVIQRRLARALDLVLRSSLPLALVAQETGFSSQSHMTRAFAQRFGAPPGKLRRARADS